MALCLTPVRVYRRFVHCIAEAIILSVRAHGEHGAIVRALTAVEGVRAGYVRGGHSRRLRPILQPGNIVLGEWRARTDAQLAALSVELIHSRAGLYAAPLPAAAIAWLTALTASALPEAQACPRLHDALAGVLGAIEAAPSAQGWAGGLARYELLVLAELGYGIDPERALPGFLRTGAAAEWGDILEALRITGPLLARDLLTDRRAIVLAARERLVDRLKSAVA